MGAAGVWHAKQPYREHHYTSYSSGYPMTRTMIYILSIDNEAAIIKAITSHRTLPVLKTFLIRPEKHAPTIRLSHIFDRHRTLSPVLCVEVSKYFLWHPQKKLPPHGEDIFCAKNDPARVRESERERENYDRHRRTKSTTFEFDAFFFFFSERQQ